MKNSLACPKCEGRKLWRIERFRYESHVRGGCELAVALPQPVPPDVHQKGRWFWQSAAPRDEWIGRYDAYICTKCGYTEFWAHSFEKLRANSAEGVHLLDNTPQQSEYR